MGDNRKDMIEAATIKAMSDAVMLNTVTFGSNRRGMGETMSREERLRGLHPGLNDLWEQYQTMLALVDDGKEEAANAKARRESMDLMRQLVGM